MLAVGWNTYMWSFCMGYFELPQSMAAEFQEQVLQETGNGSCWFLKAWSWKLLQYHFNHFLLVKQPKSPDSRGGDVDPTSWWEERQIILGPCSKSATVYYLPPSSVLCCVQAPLSVNCSPLYPLPSSNAISLPCSLCRVSSSGSNLFLFPQCSHSITVYNSSEVIFQFLSFIGRL